MIKKIFLDWGGVLAEDNNVAATRRLAMKYGVDEKVLLANLARDEDKYSSVKDNEQYYIDLSKRFGIPTDELRDALNQVPVWETYKFVRDNLDKNYDLFLLSNQMQPRTEYIRENNDLSFFKYVFFSSEIGMQKPNKDIFEHALERAGVDAGECLFVDDNKQNIEAARKIGFNVILYESFEQFKEELRSLEVNF